MILNSFHDAVNFALPENLGGSGWELLLDTNVPDLAKQPSFKFGEHYQVTGRSLLLFLMRPKRAASRRARGDERRQSGRGRCKPRLPPPARRRDQTRRRRPLPPLGACRRASFAVNRAGGPPLPMRGVDEGWHELTLDEAGAGMLYRFALPNGLKVPDPASRFQPHDVHGPSEVIDAAAYRWADQDWRGTALARGCAL